LVYWIFNWIFLTDPVYWVLSACLSFLVYALIFGRTRLNQPRSAKRLMLELLVLSPCLPLTLLILFYLVLFAIVILQFLFDPHYIWVGLPVFAIVWFLCRSSSSKFYKAVAETLLPWLIGWAIVGVTFFITWMWLPKAQWSWIFFTEKAASWIEIALDKVLPHSGIANASLLAVLFAINVLRPSWKRVTQQFQKILSGTKTALAIVAVFTSVTFFGDGQLGAVKEATAQEKYDRLIHQTTARADLMLAARLTENVAPESRDVHNYLDAVYAGVSQDVKINFIDDSWMGWARAHNMSFQDYTRLRYRTLLSDRVIELGKAIASNPTVIKIVGPPDNPRVASMLDRFFSDDQIAEAKEKFKNALDEFVKGGADLSTHPLSKMFSSVGLPDAVPEIVKDLYKAEASTLSKTITEPLADILFRAESPTAKEVPKKLSEIAKRSVFDSTALPAVVVKPTYADRMKVKNEREVKSEAVREVRRGIK
jgi:hypothetical protein